MAVKHAQNHTNVYFSRAERTKKKHDVTKLIIHLYEILLKLLKAPNGNGNIVFFNVWLVYTMEHAPCYYVGKNRRSDACR